MGRPTILFDFDGVIIDSMPIRSFGFETVFEAYPKESVQKLIEYHNANGGLSRFVKIKYFFEELLHQSASEKKIQRLAQDYSSIMKEHLTDKKIIIKETVDFIDRHHKDHPMHIVSGSEQSELQFLCKELGLLDYFISVTGSPTPKKELVKNVLREYAYGSEDVCLIGDSINDFDAARENDIKFYGYNNQRLKNIGAGYIEDFTTFDLNNA